MLMLGVHDERLRADMHASVMVMAYFQSLPRDFCLEIVINLTESPFCFCLFLNLSNRYANRRKYLKRYYFVRCRYGGTLALKSVQYRLNRYGWHVWKTVKMRIWLISEIFSKIQVHVYILEVLCIYLNMVSVKSLTSIINY